MKIKINDNRFIAVEKIAFCDNKEIKEELSVFITDSESNIVQDIALIRKGEKDNTEVLVWSDCNDEDYTDKFDIDLYESEED